MTAEGYLPLCTVSCARVVISNNVINALRVSLSMAGVLFESSASTPCTRRPNGSKLHTNTQLNN